MLELTFDGRIARLVIRRPDKKNAMNEAMWRSLGEHCSTLAQRAGQPGAPRVLLLEGGGGAFCAGADIDEMSSIVSDASRMAANNHTVTQAQLALERLPLPTIALIDGPCFGGGFGIAAACDLRTGTPRAVLAITPARLGLVYAIEDTRRIVALVGAARARRLLMRSERLDADTALQWGVLDALVDSAELEPTALAWAAQLAAQSPTSLAGIKATIGLATGNGGLAESEVRALYDAAFQGPDFAEGAAAFVAKREPRF